jgi:integrase
MIKHKYITYREDRDAYQIKIKSDGKQIVKTARTLDDAILTRDTLLKLSSIGSNRQSVVSVKRKDDDLKIIQAWKDWYTIQKAPYISDSTKIMYKSIYGAYVIPYLGGLSISAVTYEIIQAMSDDLTSKSGWHKMGISNTTVHKILSVVSGFFKYLIKQKLIKMNPCCGIKLPVKYKAKRTYFTDKDKNKLLSFIKQDNHDMYILLRAYFETGCRRAELLGLRWHNVNLKAKTIYIIDTLVYDMDGRITVKPYPKTMQSIRTIPISDRMLFSLNIIKRLQQANDKSWTDNGMVFRSIGKPYHLPNTVSRYVYSTLRKLKMTEKRLSLHSTRHTMATKLINANVPIPAIQAIGGWSSPDTILHNYAHADNKMVSQAMTLLE